MKNMIDECEGGRMLSHGGRCCGVMAMMDRAWGNVAVAGVVGGLWQRHFHHGW